VLLHALVFVLAGRLVGRFSRYADESAYAEETSTYGEEYAEEYAEEYEDEKYAEEYEDEKYAEEYADESAYAEEYTMAPGGY
jgi:hypothetical protein